MDILLTNDDGYKAKGIRVLAEIMKQFGHVTVVAPKHHQSGMGMAISMNRKALAYKEIYRDEDISWSYLDATPSSCVKFGISRIFNGKKPDVVVSGINHGSNAATASCYSGTLGAVAEAAIHDIPGIGVSLDTWEEDADFSSVEKHFPRIFEKLMEHLPSRYGVYYNVNFPSIRRGEPKGIRTASQGLGKWVREFEDWNCEALEKFDIPAQTVEAALANAEDGEKLYLMCGDFTDDPRNPADADHHYNHNGYITVVPHNIVCTDIEELARLRTMDFLDQDF